jgi:hypothetical protein
MENQLMKKSWLLIGIGAVAAATAGYLLLKPKSEVEVLLQTYKGYDIFQVATPTPYYYKYRAQKLPVVSPEFSSLPDCIIWCDLNPLLLPLP